MEENKGIIKRIIELREKFGPSQTKFGKSIGLSHAGVSQIEKGITKINEKHIKLISSVFGINEEWLRTGEGLMYKDGKVPEEEKMLEMFRALSPEGRRMVLDYINIVLANEKKMKGETISDETTEANRRANTSKSTV